MFKDLLHFRHLSQTLLSHRREIVRSGQCLETPLFSTASLTMLAVFITLTDANKTTRFQRGALESIPITDTRFPVTCVVQGCHRPMCPTPRAICIRGLLHVACLLAKKTRRRKLVHTVITRLIKRFTVYSTHSSPT